MYIYVQTLECYILSLHRQRCVMDTELFTCHLNCIDLPLHRKRLDIVLCAHHSHFPRQQQILWGQTKSSRVQIQNGSLLILDAAALWSKDSHVTYASDWLPKPLFAVRSEAYFKNSILLMLGLQHRHPSINRQTLNHNDNVLSLQHPDRKPQYAFIWSTDAFALIQCGLCLFVCSPCFV